MDAFIYMGIVGAVLLVLFLITQKKKESSQKQVNFGGVHNSAEEVKEEEEQKIEESKVKKEDIKMLKQAQIEREYEGFFSKTVRIKPNNSMHQITAIRFKNSKILLATTKNQMVMYDLKTWKKESQTPEKYFVSLDNNGASALDIGHSLYYAALTFDKTIAFYQFKGGQNKTYFKQVKRFPRNIFKTNASCLHVSPHQSYIITTGSEADTVVDVWSMNGDKLATTNSYQLQHHEMSCGNLDILIRGWTSEVKVFGVIEEKDGSFKKLQKKAHLANQQSPLHAGIDNLDMFALSINKHHKVKLWWLFEHGRKQVVSNEIDKRGFNKCYCYTFESGYGRYKGIIVLGLEKGFTILDHNLRILKEVRGVEVKEILMMGTKKRVIIGTMNNQGQILLWNLEKDLELIEDITL